MTACAALFFYNARGADVEEALLFAERDKKVYIRAFGHITAAMCGTLKAKVFELFDESPAPENLYVDLSSCEYMDSTFMGLLVGFNKRLLRAAERPITVLGANDTCTKLLKTIGIARMIVMSDEAVPFPERLSPIGGETAADAGLLLTAHDDLIELSPENERRFSALRTILAQEADKKADPGAD